MIQPPYASEIVQFVLVAIKADHSSAVKAASLAVLEIVTVNPLVVLDKALIILSIDALDSFVAAEKFVVFDILLPNRTSSNAVQLLKALS
jgi:hypothetical protein